MGCRSPLRGMFFRQSLVNLLTGVSSGAESRSVGGGAGWNGLFEREIMKDVCEEVVSAAASQNRRRASGVGQHHSARSNGLGPKRAMSVSRVFSDAKKNPF